MKDLDGSERERDDVGRGQGDLAGLALEPLHVILAMESRRRLNQSFRSVKVRVSVLSPRAYRRYRRLPYRCDAALQV